MLLGQGAGIRRLRARRQPAPTYSDLYNHLSAYWSMEGAEGKQEGDRIGSSRLLSNGTVGSVAGKAGNCRTFNAPQIQYLECASNAALQAPGLGTTPFWIGGWVYLDTGGITQYLFSKQSGGTGATVEYRALITTGNLLQFAVSDGSTITTRNSAAITPGAWTRFDAVYTGSVLRVDLNGSAGTTTAYTAGIRAGSDPLRVGSANGTPPTTQLYDGRVDELMIVKGYAPSAADITWLYNAGAGRSFADLQGYAP